jgi:uncharacterized membrane protein YeaQ/YmgE (transglycosylase-associated protein family)
VHGSGIIGVIVSGLIVGGLGRLILPGRQPIGCAFTLLIGVVGGAFGYYLGHTLWKLGDWPTFAIQILVAAALVALFGAMVRGTRPRL